MVAHVLRMNPDAPAQRALDFAFIGSQPYKPRLVRCCTNLLGTTCADLKQAGPGPTARELHCLRQRDHDKAHSLLLLYNIIVYL